jgi:hypothetical protein
MFGGSLAACLLGAFGLRRTPVEAPKAVIRRTRRVRRVIDGTSIGLPPRSVPHGPRQSTPGPAHRPAIDSNPIDSRRDSRRRPVAEHVEQVLYCFEHSAYRPGEAVDSADMKAIYLHICREIGWRPHKWNTIAAALRRVMQPGPRGGKKPYRKETDGEGREVPIPIYILPDWTADRQSTSRREAVDEQSTPERRAA